MIAFDSVSLKFRLPDGGARHILKEASFAIPSGVKLGVLGGNGAGKSTLLRLVAGIIDPDEGKIYRSETVSFPMGLAQTFHPHLTGRQNVAFVARVFGADIGAIQDYVLDFSELGPYFDAQLGTYSSGMMAKFSFGISIALEFDFYLIDEITEVGDARFREKCARILREKIRDKGMLVVSHNSQTIKNFCQAAAILHEGRLEFFDTVEEAFVEYRKMMGTPLV